MIAQLMQILDTKTIKNKTYDFYTYCIADGVKYPMLYSDLEEGALEYDILFREEALREKLHTVAPFLIQLSFEDEIQKEESEAVVEQCYGKNGAIFFTTPLTFHEALEKMREIFYLHDEAGEIEGVLRFYEPLVFLELIREASSEVQRDIFSKIYCYWCEDTTDNIFMKYIWDETHVRYQAIHLDEAKGIDNETT